jgi:predicted dehydrogenase
MLKSAVIGYGYWGPNLVRNFMEAADSTVVGVCDSKPEQLKKALNKYPGLKVTQDSSELIRDPSVDAVIISTPVSTHFELAKQALASGKHVFIEKPMTSSSGQARELIDEAARRKRILMVDHTFVYTPAIQKIKSLVEKGELGDLYYYDSTRINLGLFQHDVNVLWDLAVHDLGIIDYLLGNKPVSVSATGISHIKDTPHNTAYLTLFFEKNLIAHINASWLAPVKVRLTLIGGSKKMIVFDDLEPSEKIKVYDKGITLNNSSENLYKLLVGYRSGDMWSPQLENTEALRTEVAHFLTCIQKGQKPLTDGEAGLRVVRILEAASASILDQGRNILL